MQQQKIGETRVGGHLASTCVVCMVHHLVLFLASIAVQPRSSGYRRPLASVQWSHIPPYLRRSAHSLDRGLSFAQCGGGYHPQPRSRLFEVSSPSSAAQTVYQPASKDMDQCFYHQLKTSLRAAEESTSREEGDIYLSLFWHSDGIEFGFGLQGGRINVVRQPPPPPFYLIVPERKPRTEA
nr:unnamed protein product [Spirometra erinaceieuropaei]